LADKWYANGVTLLTNIIEDMLALLHVVESFNAWLGTRFNIDKCKITVFIHAFQSLRNKKGRDEALKARLSHIYIEGRYIGSLIQDESLPVDA
jgi:hypothetical protein